MQLAIIMDPIDKIKPQASTDFAMLLEAQQRYGSVRFIDPTHVWLQDGIIWAKMRKIQVQDTRENYYEFITDYEVQPLSECDVVLMRKDPPFDMDYIFLTYLLEQAEQQGCIVVNKPASLRDANEKLFTAWFPHCCPKSLVTSQIDLIRDFASAESEIIIKPLNGNAGSSIFRVKAEDPNFNVIAENMTRHGRELVMVQQFLPAISEGDKRIILINGEPIPYALARIPSVRDFRGNLGKGATAEGRELTEHDHWIASEVGPVLRDKGLLFVGLDVIGKYLTEINVTSPTGVRELDHLFDTNICGTFFDQIEAQLVVH